MDHAAPTEDRVTDVTTLEAVVGARPLPAMMKSISALDDHCAAILRHAVVGVATHPDGRGGMRAVVLGGRAGFARPDGPSTLAVELPATPGRARPWGCWPWCPAGRRRCALTAAWAAVAASSASWWRRPSCTAARP